MVRAGVSVTWNVLSWSEGYKFKHRWGQTWGAQYFCLSRIWSDYITDFYMFLSLHLPSLNSTIISTHIKPSIWLQRDYCCLPVLIMGYHPCCSVAGLMLFCTLQSVVAWNNFTFCMSVWCYRSWHVIQLRNIILYSITIFGSSTTQTEVRTPSSTWPGFKPMTSRSWQYIPYPWDDRSNHSAIRDL